jgi:hypothetical protein
VKDAASVIEKPSARWRQNDAAPVSRKKRCLELNLESSDMSTEGGLRNLQNVRRLADAAQFRDANEIAKLLDVHDW